MQTGLEFGFRVLSPAELADCYDEMCNCGKSHDPENINKLRTRVIKIMDRLVKTLAAESAEKASCGTFDVPVLQMDGNATNQDLRFRSG
jgi:hypothetical protein